MKFHYDENHTKAIEFPLGGIGTGNISLTGNGELINWELFSQPNKDSYNDYTHFAIKAERDGKVLSAKVMHGDIQQDFTGHGFGGRTEFDFGEGPSRFTMEGLPHFESTTFSSTFPFSEINFNGDFPGDVKLEAFNPFIPSNDKDSSLPCAFFTVKIHNNTQFNTNYTVALSTCNPLIQGTVNTAVQFDNNIKGIMMTGNEDKENPRINGSVCVTSNGKNIQTEEYWHRGGWYDNLIVYWQDFTSYGPMPQRHYDAKGTRDMCTLSSSIEIPPYTTKKINFAISWYVPIFVKTWDTKKPQSSWKNYICKLFNNHEDLIKYIYENWQRLQNDSLTFANALSQSDMPYNAIESVCDNLAIFKSHTCERLENGEFYAFEGIRKNSGSCEGSCTHVWNYVYSLPFLFPKLARSMAEVDYTYNQLPNGGMVYRLMLPLGAKKAQFKPCVDGQMGGVIKFYREWKLSGNDKWLRKWWPKVHKALSYAWDPNNENKWDPNKTGIISGTQNSTLDVEIFGPNSWLNGMYVAALKAASEICDYLGDIENANTYREMAKHGQDYMEKELFNGKYYIQKLDIHNKEFLQNFGQEYVNSYWDGVSEIKYQYIQGCEIDQVLGQWHSYLNGLGDIFDANNVRSAMSQLFKNNFLCMRNHFNPCRLFCVNDEKGLVLCSWPDGIKKPKFPTPYLEENMTGFEYAAAQVMIMNNLEDEALKIISSIRDRYDGNKRNPFSEIECGSSYSRAMASYSFIPLYSGFSFNMQRNNIGFNPLHLHNGYKTFWSVDGAWGEMIYIGTTWNLHVLYGEIKLSSITLPQANYNLAILNGKRIPINIKGNEIKFNHKVAIKKDCILQIL